MVVEEDHGMHRVLRSDGSRRRCSSSRVEGVVGVERREGQAFHAIAAHGPHRWQSDERVDAARVQRGALRLQQYSSWGENRTQNETGCY